MSDLRGGSTVAGQPIVHQGNMFGMMHSMLDFELTGPITGSGKINEKTGKLTIATQGQYIPSNWLQNQTITDGKKTPTLGAKFDFLPSNATNKPTMYDGALLTMAYSDKYAFRMAFDWRTGNIFTRRLTGGSWNGGGDKWHNVPKYIDNVRLNDSATIDKLIAQLQNYGAFNNSHVTVKCAWDYAGNSDLVTGHNDIGTVELAGCVIETWGNDAVKHIKITTPNVNSTGKTGIFIYNDQGEGYSPGWRKVINVDQIGIIRGHNAFSATSASGHYSEGAIEIREAGLVSNTRSSMEYAPMIGFHWGSVYQSRLAMNSSGDMVISKSNGAWGKIWHSENDGTGSGLDADLLRGAFTSEAADAWTIAKRDGAGDITARLFRTTYGTKTDAPPSTAEFIFRYNSTDNYMRPLGAAAFQSWLKNSAYLMSREYRTAYPPSNNCNSADYDGWNLTYWSTGISYHPGSKVGNNAGPLMSMNYSSAWSVQLASNYHVNGQLAIRSQINGAWQPWLKVWTEGNDGENSGLDAHYVCGRQFWSSTTAPSGTARLVSNSYLTATKVFNQVYGDVGEWMKLAEGEKPIPGKAYVATKDGLKIADSIEDRRVVGFCTDQAAVILNGDYLRDEDDEIVDGIQGIDSDGDPAVCISVSGRVPVFIDGDHEIGDLLCTNKNGNSIVSNTERRGTIMAKVLGEKPYHDGRIWVLCMMS